MDFEAFETFNFVIVSVCLGNKRALRGNYVVLSFYLNNLASFEVLSFEVSTFKVRGCNVEASMKIPLTA